LNQISTWINAMLGLVDKSLSDENVPFLSGQCGFVCWVCCVVTMMTTLCVSVQRLREFNVYLCKKSLRKPKMIILFMDVYKVQSGFYWSVAWDL